MGPLWGGEAERSHEHNRNDDGDMANNPCPTRGNYFSRLFLRHWPRFCSPHKSQVKRRARFNKASPILSRESFSATGVKCQYLPWAIGRNVLEDFCCINFGGFSRGFSWRIFLGTFSHKNEEKKSGEKIREINSGGSKLKICKKIRSAESRP